MKRFTAIILAGLLLFSLCACGGNTANTGTNEGGANNEATVISDELQGKWYGPNSEPELDINADGTGTVLYREESFDAVFTAENDVFTVTSEGYSISGNYTLEGEKLTVTANFASKDYTLIFTRTPVELPEGSYIYNYEDITYEIIPTDGIITVCEFPPSDTPPTKEIYFEYIEENIYIIHILPHYEGEIPTSPTTPEAPDIPVPEEIDTNEEKPKVKIGGSDTEVYKGSDDISGIWTTNMDTTVSFFGVTNTTTTPITYTFNSDGTGSILAMGIIPGTLTYTCENGVLTLTVTMLGDTETGTGYVKRVGDTLYVQNLKGEIQALSKQG